MTASDGAFVAAFGSSGGAWAYETVLVPRLFTHCAIALLIRLGLHPGETLVDIACGTGIVPRIAAPILGPAGRVIARDLSEEMLALARRTGTPARAAPTDWGIAAADHLDVDAATADAITCQQGLQFFPDPTAAVAEMHRVLRPGGRVGIAVWRDISECPLWASVRVAVTGQFGSEVADTLTAPFSWPGEEALLDILVGAGFSDPLVSTHAFVMHFEGGMTQAVPAMAATPIGPLLKALPPSGYRQFLDDATSALGLSAAADDPVDIPAATLVATARRPPAAAAR